MKKISIKNWVQIAFINFLLVSLYGLVMRYKIRFDLPFLDQKNLQHAHSHFAFAGWVSLLIMVLMVYAIRSHLSEKSEKKYSILFISHLLTAYGSIISFTIQGYGLFSIVFSVLSIVLAFIFAGMYYQDVKSIANFQAKKWFIAGLLFSVLSSVGTFYLSYMMATKHIEQHAYLASIYWYLHFQYNGWFFFGTAGLFINYLQEKNLVPTSINSLFWIFAISCVPGYGLSILWINLPVWLYIIVTIAAIAQFYAITKFLFDFNKLKPAKALNWNGLVRFLMLFVGFALFMKLLLQLGSTIPALAKFAFGYRPVVIAYLHLVLLAYTSLFLVVFVYLKGFLPATKWTHQGMFWLSIGILLNEFVLGIQGIFSLNYTIVPYANEMLFGIAILIFISLIILNVSIKGKASIEK